MSGRSLFCELLDLDFRWMMSGVHTKTSMQVFWQHHSKVKVETKV